MTNPKTKIETEYLMTLHAPIAGTPLPVNGALTIFHSTGGWAKGPRIGGAIVPPTGDWLRATPDGSLRVDARMTVKTDDGALIHVAYGGVISVSNANFARMAAGGTLTADDMYFVTAPTFETAHEKYA